MIRPLLCATLVLGCAPAQQDQPSKRPAPPAPSFRFLSEPPKGLPPMPKPEGYEPTEAMFELGKKLFFDGILSGDGEVFLAAYGGFHEIELDGELKVDTGHLIAFETGLAFKVRPAARGLRAALFSGEGLVCILSGKGKVWLQARNAEALAEFMLPHVSA